MSDQSASSRRVVGGLAIGFGGGLQAGLVLFFILRLAGVTSTVAGALIPIIIGVFVMLALLAYRSRRTG